MSSLEQVLKAYEGPDQFFLHNINAASLATGGNLLMRSAGQVVEPDGVEPTTSCLQSRRSTN
jgi:hypothetical protein